MSSAFSEVDLTSITENIDKLRHSARRTVPMFAVGILSTVVAAGIALWYIFSLSADLQEARAALRVSETKLAEALDSLQVANRALQQARQAGGTPGSERQIAAAISDVSRSQKDLAVASASLRVATGKLPAASASEQAAADKQIVAATGWFAVLGSYPLNPSGLDAAQGQVRKIQAAGQCAELWQTQISRNYAVVLGSSTSRDAAAANVKRAQVSGMAKDAFVQRNRDWTRLPQSTIC